MKRVYLLAHPAMHSISPYMHNAAFIDLGINAHYDAWDVPPESLKEVVESLRQSDVYGANVTIPHKLAVIPLMDELSDAAKAIGAVNTIINKEGQLLGHNTDATGYIRALKEDADYNLKGKKVVILGAGGAARAIVYALLKEGVKSLSIYNRTLAKAEHLASEFAVMGPVRATLDLEQEAVIADLLINTTSVGMEHDGVDPDISPIPKELLPKQGLVSDIVYRPQKTRLLKEAEAAGLATQNGIAMLVYQGAESFERWTMQSPDVSVMLTAAQKALMS